ncbi:MAG: FAD-dependent oxidoreductase [bacterium]|nr:FAD-dependent oxidoreductase [bacterium]
MKTILILGAGFGGLRTTLYLGKKIKRAGLNGQYEIVLVDKNDYHTYTPTLYEIATTSKETADYLQLKRIVTFPIRDIVYCLPITFRQGIIKNLDIERGAVIFEDGQVMSYEYAVIATGSVTNDFGIPGVREYALEMKTFLGAVEIRDRIFEFLEEYHDPTEDQNKKERRIVVGGGGSTGVELAGELAEWIFDPMYPKNCGIKISVIEGNKTILNNFDPRIITAVTTRLKKLGVEIMTDESITSVKKNKINLKNSKTIPYDLFIWTGGVKAPDMLGNVPLQIEQQGKIKVEEAMLCVPNTEHLHLGGEVYPYTKGFGVGVYGLGDSVCFYDPKTQRPIVGVARAAISQGTVVAKNIFEDIRLAEELTKKAQNNNLHKKYVAREYPYIIPVGGKWAVAKIGPFIIKGFLGWILKGLVELSYLASIMPLGKALSIWFAGLKIFIKNDRLG